MNLCQAGKAMRKRRHHYVPKFYLEPWSENGRILCLRKGQIKRLGLNDVGVEEDFYAISNLTPEDIEVLRRCVIAPSNEGARNIHESLLRDFAQVAYANRLLKQRPEMADQAKKIIRETVSNLDENYHEAIEHDLQYAIRCMLSGGVEFFSDVSVAGSFLRALALFSLRTKARREAMKSHVRMPLADASIDRIFGPMIHMLAVNVGGTLLVDRARFRIVLLNNETAVPFITGDQPVINIHEHRDEMGTQREVEWYMPLSPKMAMLYILAENAAESHSATITEAELRNYNARIAEHSHDQLYGDSQESLLLFSGVVAPSTRAIPARSAIQ
jgi:hypothetical protein